MKKIVSTLGFLLLTPTFALAHSTVSPSSVSTSQYQTFSLSVPTEKEIPTTAVRLLLPDGLDRVTPLVKPGWRIDILKDSSGKVTELRWIAGSIPAGQKDVFEFSARTPASSTSLVWKAYQTYENGTVVAWDRDPKAGGEVSNPYSITEVMGPVLEAPTPEAKKSDQTMAIVALAISIAALGLSLRNRRSLQ